MRTTARSAKFAHIRPGIYIRKDARSDDKTRDEGLEVLTKEVSDALVSMKEFKTKSEESFKVLKDLREEVANLKTVDAEKQAQLKKAADDFADATAKVQACEAAIETFKKEMDAPIYRGGKDLADHDRKTAIDLQRRVFLFKNGEDREHEFKANLGDLVNLSDARSAMRKLMRVGLETKADIVSRFSDGERKAFEASGLDIGFFPPEILGITIDCTIECAELLDLYQQITVTRDTFMFPHIESYGDLGRYDCDAKCDAEYGPEGNITWKNGNTYDFRGVFCLQTSTLRNAAFDFLQFMFNAVARSYRINRNRALITGDGINEPLGWLTADCFSKVAAPSQNPTHQDLRQFLASAPVEYGRIVATMHQNVFAYFASMVDANGRFIFGDGLMGFGPDDVRDRIRISNCLPDPTDGGTKGSAAAPFDAGAFIMAAGNWERAYALINQRPMFMQQWQGGTTAWCVKYQFGARDGGMVTCCPAARTFVAGAAAAPTP